MIRWLIRRVLGFVGCLPDRAIAALAGRIFSRSWRRFQYATAHPRAVQEQKLFDIVGRAKDTAFGREHGFDAITTLESYQARVPIRTYDGFAPYIQRMVEGEEGVLIAESPSFFARSSGTTGTPKYIPVTRRYLDEFRRPRRVWARQVMQAFPGLIRGKILTIHSPGVDGYTAAGVPYGSITVAMNQGTRFDDPAGFDAVPREVFAIDDFALKYYVLLRLAIQQDVRLCAAINPSTLVLIARKLDEFATRLAADLEAGTLDVLDALDPELQKTLSKCLRACPDLARKLKKAQLLGRVLPKDVWPNIVGLLCWKGGSAPFYLAQLESLYPGVEQMDYGFLATEGGFSIPLSPAGASGVVSVDAHFLEFVPVDADAPVRLADALVVGDRYRVIVTGSHGLYRYDIQDVVECVGYHRRTALIRFVHKANNVLSITGEKVGESHVVAAFAQVAAQTQLPLKGFCVSVELGQTPRYVFGIEPENELDDALLSKLLSAVERALRTVNIEYAAKRDSLRLGAPELIVFSSGAFERERARRVAQGAADSHVKPPHLLGTLSELRSLGVERSFSG